MKKNVFPREIWLADLKDNENANGMLLKDIHPILILNDFKTLSKQDLIQIVPITSNTERFLRSHLKLEGYGLDLNSKALFEQTTTIHRDQLLQRLGKVDDPETNKKIDNMIRKTILVNSESKLNLDNVVSTFNKQLEEKAELEKLNIIVTKIRESYFAKEYEVMEELTDKLIGKVNKASLERTVKNNLMWTAFYFLAVSNYDVKNIDLSIEYIEKSLKYINSVDDKHHFAMSMWYLGNCFAEIDREDEAADIFKQLSKYYKANNMLKERFVCVFNITFCNRNFNMMNKIIKMIEDHKSNTWFTEIDKEYVIKDLKSEVKRLRDKLNIN
ncbi:type II toxin-antitoxin system PemK/MazF family toxin [Clostridium sp. YIM B02505]|uniref:Type II toxin-antitoxin system PemK/MazF family toxin n=1 Tax=Clostridium yunnanense TaxID=2800325 RepID=A0ABS1EIF4_9CLOT|nr:type II toxin-antitoxin system PemK/MazF family toxin [Clostridium yunnanense]MBK1809165.1 type II toxin-antitoxin system PemK/MazF family toxin [Clostridium yunnanense]